MDILINIVSILIFVGLVGFIGFKILKKKVPKLANKIEDEVEEVMDKVKK